MYSTLPAPPPTSNKLTAQQRALLVRKSKKIEQILGSTPYLVDTSVDPASLFHVTLPNSYSRRSHSMTVDYDSFCTSSSSSSESSLHIASIRSTKSSKSRKRRHSTIITDDPRTWPQDEEPVYNKIPLLRLTLKSLHLEPINTPPTSTRGPLKLVSADQRASECPNNSSEGFAQQLDNATNANSTTTAAETVSSPTDVPSPTSSLLFLPSFTIPTVNSIRKAKMDRLRKKLGSDVPLDLVFPKEVESPVLRENSLSEKSPVTSPVVESPPAASPVVNSPPASPIEFTSPVPIGTTPPSSPPLQSMALLPVSAPASPISSLPPPPRPKKNPKRLVHTPSKHGPRYRKARLATGPPAPTVHMVDFKPLKERLSFIMESPEEYSIEPKEFVLSRVVESPNNSRPSTADSQFSTTSSVAWSMTTGSTALTSPTTSSCALSDPSRPTTPGRKRTSSYRKPPPPITDELMNSLAQTMIPTYHP